ncbi:MAG: efflux RND transporter periplasmic adaptor subunit [Gemmatimonadales bacterium]|nr:efflux RND transporter periplasmic adaptor subunit [Gemmatimonadales bacterium]
MTTLQRGARLRDILIFVAVLGAAGLLAWYFAERSAPGGEATAHNHGAVPTSDSARAVMLSTEAARRIGVTYAGAQLGPLERVVRTVAILSYDETRLKSVTSRVDGWVDELYVNFSGQAVRIGDPLVALYSPMLVAAQQELLLAKRLRGDVAAGTPDAVRSADDLLESARRRLLYWEVPPEVVRQIEESGVIRKTVTFRSPVNGVVIEKNVLAGQRIMAGEAIYRIADLGTVWLDGEVFERDLPSVRVGREVVAEFPALPGGPRTGRITYVYPTINPETRTARVRVTLPNPGLVLKPGMYATFRFAAATEPVLSVPRSAVLSTGKRNLVFVRLPDGMLAPRDVGIGLATDDRIEVRSGLTLGDTVVSSATFLVDAESNLGSLLGGMGGMPGMDMTAPTVAKTARAPSAVPGAPKPAKDTMKMKMPMPNTAGAPGGHTHSPRD